MIDKEILQVKYYHGDIKQQVVSVLEYRCKRVVPNNEIRMINDEQMNYIIEQTIEQLKFDLVKDIRQFVDIVRIDDYKNEYVFEGRIGLPYIANEKIKELEKEISRINKALDKISLDYSELKFKWYIKWMWWLK